MKKIIIIVTALVLLVGVILMLTRNKESGNRLNVKTGMVMSDDSGTYIVAKNPHDQNDTEIIQIMAVQDTAAEMLSELDWVDHAVVTISYRDPFVAAVLTVNREPSPDEADSAAYIISQYVDEDADILITDQDGNVIYPISN